MCYHLPKCLAHAYHAQYHIIIQVLVKPVFVHSRMNICEYLHNAILLSSGLFKTLCVLIDDIIMHDSVITLILIGNRMGKERRLLIQLSA